MGRPSRLSQGHRIGFSEDFADTCKKGGFTHSRPAQGEDSRLGRFVFWGQFRIDWGIFCICRLYCIVLVLSVSVFVWPSPTVSYRLLDPRPTATTRIMCCLVLCVGF